MKKTTLPNAREGLAPYWTALATLTGAALGFLLCWLTPLWKISKEVGHDLLHRATQAPVPDDVVVIALDERSHEILGEPYDRTWDRQLHAELIQRLREQGARLIVFDIVFDSYTTTDEPNRFDLHPSDQALAEAVRGHSDVILAASVFADPNDPLKMMRAPIRELRSPRGVPRNWGVAYIEPAKIGRDQVVRRIPFGYDSTRIFSLVAAQRFADVPIENPSDTAGKWLRYLGPPQTVPFVEYHYVYNDNLPPSYPDDFFKGKICFVGGNYAVGFTGAPKDTHPTPFQRFDENAPVIQGVELHAHLFENYRTQSWFVMPPLAARIGLLVLFPLLAALLFPVLPLRLLIAVAVVLVALSGWVLLTTAQANGWVFEWLVVPVAMMPLAGVGGAVLKALDENKRSQQISVAFETYLPRSFARQVQRQGGLVEPGGEERAVTILMTDLAGFTTLSENARPRELVAILHEYFNDLVETIHSNKGSVISFIGDAVLAVWGDSEELPDQADHAVRAARQIVEVTSNKTYYGHMLVTRQGLSYGTVLVGNLGGINRMNYTVIGDNVNLAARLEGMNKQMGSSVLISEAVFEKLSDPGETRYVGRLTVKGKQKSVPIYQAFTVADTRPDPQVQEEIEAALRLADEGDSAAAIWRLRSIAGDDPVAAYHLAQAEAEVARKEAAS